MAANEKRIPSRDIQPHRKRRSTKKTVASTTRYWCPKPPDGYVFVPKGDVYITRKCTTLTRESGRDVHIVHSQNGTRLGLHVPKQIWKLVLLEAAQTATKRREAVRRKDERDSAKARAVLRKRYPKMPASDLEKVLKHAFMKGSGRVGRAGRQSVERRASLAVGAYLRHHYTAYEDILNRRKMSREQAREEVWKTVRDVKLSWTDNHSHTSKKAHPHA